MIHTEIFNMVYYGKGGWNFDDLYNMPVHLRRFYKKQMIDAVKAQKQEVESVKRKVP